MDNSAQIEKETMDQRKKRHQEKIKMYFALVAIAVGAAVVYGIFQSQVGYSISKELYGIEFVKSGILNPNLHNRRGAALVGIYSSWWMGLLMGLVLAGVCLVYPSPKTMLKNGGIGISIAFGVSLLFLLVGTQWPVPFFDLDALSQFYFKNKKDMDEVSFSVGHLNITATKGELKTDKAEIVKTVNDYNQGLAVHGFGYAGGAAGLLSALLFVLITHFKKKN